MPREIRSVLFVLGLLSGVAGAISLIQRGTDIELSRFHEGAIAYYRGLIQTLHSWIPHVLPQGVKDFVLEHAPFLATQQYLDTVAIGFLCGAVLVAAGNTVAEETEGKYEEMGWPGRTLMILILAYTGFAPISMALVLTTSPIIFLMSDEEGRRDALAFFKTAIRVAVLYIAGVAIFYATNAISV